MQRTHYIAKITEAFRVNPCVALLGPRQCGKTTLAREYGAQSEKKESVTYFDLENPFDIARLTNPMLALSEIKGLIIIDEIQRRPELFPSLRVLIDQDRKKRRFLILGSASRDLIQQSSETLAGRISYLELTPFTLFEIGDWQRLWLRGGFPNSYLAKSNDDSYQWRAHYVSTFLERDIPNLGIKIPAKMLRRFWMMLTHYHGQIFNSSEIGTALGVAHTTARYYLDILTGTFMIRELTPWFENINKRQIKSPKIYFRDSGLLHYLLGIPDRNVLHHNPKIGASWEGFALEAIIDAYQATPEEVYFWGVHNQVELDLLIIKKGQRIGFEFKYSDSPTLTKSMHQALELLKLDHLYVVYPGTADFSLTDKIRVISLLNIMKNGTQSRL
ncbi:MAG: ATP-binding protein [Gammaproteobacteria bacterium]|nr:ATP-binding protein [Gammaproteobacteria bacterium]